MPKLSNEYTDTAKKHHKVVHTEPLKSDNDSKERIMEELIKALTKADKPK